MNEFEIKELQEQNQQLRYLVMSLSAALLRKIAAESEMVRPLDRADAERLMHEAEECFHCARIPGLNGDIAQGLEAAGRELMAKAVEIETRIQRASREC